jgi:dolichol-phosphate mannosyltransferase
MGSLAVVVPAHNQAAQLEALLPCLPGTVVVVDDGSTDQTKGTVRFARRRGYGAALQAGFAWALERGFERVATFDGDGQHDPADLPRLLEQDADIVSGSRFQPSSPRRGHPPPQERQAVNQAILERLNPLTGWNLTDAFCGLKVYRSDALRKLRLDEPGYAMPIQLWIQAHKAGLTVREVPVACIYHTASAGRPLQDYLSVLERELCSTCSR